MGHIIFHLCLAFGIMLSFFGQVFIGVRISELEKRIKNLEEDFDSTTEDLK